MTEKVKSFLVTFFVGLGVAAIAFWLDWRADDLLRKLCDAFTVSAVVLLAIGCMGVTAKTGFFDLILYGVKTMTNVRWPWLNPAEKNQKKETFVEYKERKREERQTPVGILLAGAAHLAISAVFLTVYYL